MEGYLSNAISDEEIQYAAEKIEFLNQNKISSPILREVEFRARVRNFGEGFEDYRLRFSPLNPFERKASKKYEQALGEQFKTEYRLNLEEVLLSRYLLMNQHIKGSNLLSQHTGSEQFYSNMLEIARQKAGTADLKDYISLDKAHLEAVLALERIKNELQIIEQTMSHTYSFADSITWDVNVLVSIEFIREWLATTHPELQNNLLLKNELEKENLSAIDYRIEKNQTFRNIGYVQLEYREDIDNLIEENLGVQLAVTLPITNEDRANLQLQKLDMLDESQKLEKEKMEIEAYMKTHFKNLTSAFRRYDLISAKLESYDGREFTSGSSKNALELMLELHDFKTELSGLKIKAEAEIRSLYIELLSLNGKLSEQPYINYLSSDKNAFDLAR
jgi:uncharacterized protein (UPF0335 family)